MKVVLYMAMTVNGMIAGEDDRTPWSEEEWESYNSIVKKFGNLVIGRRTYDLMSRDDSFSKLNNPAVVVLTSKKLKYEGNAIFVKSPIDAIEVLGERGFKEILIGGGGKVNSSFLKKCLVDEIILDVEPLVFGKGIRLFAEDDFEAKLKLLKTKKLSDNTIQLRYKVMR